MEDISEIVNSLSGEDIDKLKTLANDIFAGDKKESKKGNDNISNPGIDAESVQKISILFIKISRVLSRIKNNPQNSTRTNFINSLKPLLSDRRREKADEAIKMMNLFEILPLLKDSGLFKL